MIKIFIGYDSRETIAFHVCNNSIVRHALNPVSITPLSLQGLSSLYTELHTDGSNAFTYTRFLVPHLSDYKGWAIFIDGDMILRDDITNLWNLRDDSKAVMVVKHDYKTTVSEKYLKFKNENYPRKNWSSVMLWNCGHPANSILTPEFIQNASGADVHRFTWLSDNLIGDLPLEWNWLVDEFGVNDSAKLIHFTLGAPCFNQFAETHMASEWHLERKYTEYCIDTKSI